MLHMKAAFLLLAAALLAGCSTTLVRENPVSVRVADGVQLETAPLVEALLKFRGTRVQAANGSWKDQVFSAQCVLKGDGEKLIGSPAMDTKVFFKAKALYAKLPEMYRQIAALQREIDELKKKL